MEMGDEVTERDREEGQGEEKDGEGVLNPRRRGRTGDNSSQVCIVYVIIISILGSTVSLPCLSYKV